MMRAPLFLSVSFALAPSGPFASNSASNSTSSSASLPLCGCCTLPHGAQPCDVACELEALFLDITHARRPAAQFARALANQSAPRAAIALASHEEGQQVILKPLRVDVQVISLHSQSHERGAVVLSAVEQCQLAHAGVSTHRFRQEVQPAHPVQLLQTQPVLLVQLSLPQWQHRTVLLHLKSDHKLHD